MTINIESGSSGWGNYVLYGTKDKPRDSDKVQFLEGDIALGDRLSQSNNYEESYYKILLAFEGKPSDEVMKSAYEDFKKEMFVGFKRDEFHIDAVIHKDTDNYHIHCRVPKQNLLTDTHLQLFMDKIDRPRKQLIQDHISLKYGFEIAREKDRKIFKEENTKINIINQWREEHNQKPFDLKSKDGQKEAENQINSYVSDLIKSDLISSQNDIKDTLQELGLKVEKFGHDIKKDFSYVTVSNETGKLRIKGDIYNDKFYEHNREDRSSQIDNNRRIEQEREPNQERAERVRAELNRANEKRFRTVTKLFKHSRARAEREHKQTLEVGELESVNTNKSIKSNSRSIDRNTDTKTANEVGAVHREPKLYSDRQKQLPEIPSKRAYLRPTKESLLLQNQLKERTNARYYDKVIERARKSREDEQRAISRVTASRENEYTNFARMQSKIREFGEKISGAFARAREKTLTTINEMKEALKTRVKSSREKAEAPDKSDSSSLNRIKEVQNNDLKAYAKAELEQSNDAPVKKRSKGRER